MYRNTVDTLLAQGYVVHKVERALGMIILSVGKQGQFNRSQLRPDAVLACPCFFPRAD